MRRRRAAVPGRIVVAGALALVAALVLQLAFLASYVGALHEPSPHRVPVAVVAPQPAAGQVAQRLDAVPGGPLRARPAASFAAARARIADGDAYGIYVPARPGDRAGARPRLYVATAAGRSVATALPQIFRAVARGARSPAPQGKDLAPLPPHDPNGLSGFYAVVSWMVCGYFGATLLGMLGEPRSRSRTGAALRIGGLVVLSVLAGVLSKVVLTDAIGVLHGHFAAVAAIGALAVFAAGAATVALQSVLGIAGTGAAILLFVVLGNPSSGGPYAPELLPGFWRAIGDALPPGAATTLVRDVAYLGGHGTRGPWLVLAIWAAAGAAVTVVRGGRAVSEEQAEGEAVAGVAGI